MQQHDLAAFAKQVDARLPKSTQAYEIIRAAIIAMKLPPTAPIIERDICSQLGVSRTPVREAILQLATESLVVVKPGGGTFVNSIILKEVLDGQITRDTLEMRLVRLAARNYDVSFESEFEVALFRQQNAADRKDVDEFFDLDNQFHRLICNCSGFPSAWRTIHGATGQLDRVRRHAFPMENHFFEVLSEHTKMFSCIKSRDEEGASRIFQIQLDSTFPTLELLRKVSPDLMSYEGEVSIADIR